MLLKKVNQVTLPDGDRRSHLRLCLAHALVEGLGHGSTAAQPWLTEAFAGLQDVDKALRVETLIDEYIVAPKHFATHTRSELEALAQSTGMARARFLVSTDAGSSGLEDPLLAALRCVRMGASALDAVVSSGFLALVPRTLGFHPGKRVYLDARADRVILEDHGTLLVRTAPPQRTLALLSALANGAMTKEALVQHVWKIRNYAPERHDSVVHTTISRVRTFLEPYAGWLQATPVGYELVGISVVVVGEAPSPTDIASTHPIPELTPQPFLGKQDQRKEEVLTLLRSGPLSTTEIARGLHVSEMTAFRALSELVKSGCLARQGEGKNTRYALT